MVRVGGRLRGDYLGAGVAVAMSVEDRANAGYETENEVLDPAKEFAESVVNQFMPLSPKEFTEWVMNRVLPMTPNIRQRKHLSDLIANELRAEGWIQMSLDVKDPAQEFGESVAAKCFGPNDEYDFGGGEEELAELIASELRDEGWVKLAEPVQWQPHVMPQEVPE